MSKTEKTPKKSILTDAMERAREIQDAKKLGVDIHTSEEIAMRRFMKRTGIVIASATAAVTIAIVITKTMRNGSTEITPED